MSIFQEFDIEVNQSDNFWTSLDSFTLVDVTEHKLFQSPAKLKKLDGTWKTRTIILTTTTLYLCAKGSFNPKKKSIIIWKTVDAFEEQNDQDSSDRRYVLKIGSQVSEELYLENSDILETWLTELSKVGIMTDFDGDFALIKEIGSGNYAVVHQVTELSSLAEYAVKSVHKAKIHSSSRGVSSIISEITVMRKLRHPNLVQLHKVYESEETVHLILDYLPGGNLFQRILQVNRYPEPIAAKFMANMLSTLDYLESQSIVHRDLKPENIIMHSLESHDTFKIADFGLACLTSDTQSLRCGSPGYIAPEILNKQSYDCKADVFSVGVLLYILLSGRAPFYGHNANEIIKKNQTCRIYFNGDEWQTVSTDSVDLVMQLTSVSPESRPSARQALDHRWLSLGNKSALLNFLKPAVGKVAFESPKQGFSCSLMQRIKEGREKGIILQGDEERKVTQGQVVKASGILKKLREEENFK